MNIPKLSLFEELEQLETEQRNPETLHIDLAEAREIASIMNRQDKLVADCVEQKLDAIAKAIDIVCNALKSGGRLLYIGSGTSGRLGVLDASECPPTFGTDPSQVVGIIAGGNEAMFKAKEGAEDSPENGANDISEKKVCSRDIVCGLAASGRTPYVHGALVEARKRGCKTILVCCVKANQVTIDIKPDVIIDIPVGPEVIMGSTRLKSATAQKMVCNMITTGAMVRMGKIYENVMVDLMLTNKKLVERSRRIVMMFTKLPYEEASELLKSANGHVKVALLMHLGGLERNAANKHLEEHEGFIRAALLGLKK
ncbi:MAG: N-acetylmuramic acid 6-phosphate etherase [Balneolales bacterium]